jgi:hypothetical protein
MSITETCLPYKSPSIRVEKTTNLWCVLSVHVCGFLLGRKSTNLLERKKTQAAVIIGGS